MYDIAGNQDVTGIQQAELVIEMGTELNAIIKLLATNNGRYAGKSLDTTREHLGDKNVAKPFQIIQATKYLRILPKRFVNCVV